MFWSFLTLLCNISQNNGQNKTFLNQILSLDTFLYFSDLTIHENAFQNRQPKTDANALNRIVIILWCKFLRTTFQEKVNQK